MLHRMVLGFRLSFLVGIGLLVWTGCGEDHDHSKHKHGASEPQSGPDKLAPSAGTPQEPATKPYPLKTCVVSGEELGKMGEPKRIVYEGQEIKFCCPSCEKDFRKEPAKFLKKIEGARKGS